MANVEDGSCDCGDATAYIVNMTDSFGDGWNGNHLIITNSVDGTVAGSFTIDGEFLMQQMEVLHFVYLMVVTQ